MPPKPRADAAVEIQGLPPARTARRRVHEVLEAAEKHDALSRAFDAFIYALIVANVAAVALESVETLNARFGGAFRALELFSIAVFTIEYVARLWACTAVEGLSHPVLGRLRFALRPMLLVDLLAILPFYLSVFLALDLRFVRVLRLLRLFKLTRHSAALRLLGNVFRAKANELVLAFSVLAIALVFSASVMFYLEHAAQPEAFPDIPGSMWWSTVTIATVGYGDVVPVTPWGRVVGGFIMVLGIAVYALPVAILSSGFTDELNRSRARSRACPHCGKELE